MIKSNIIQQGAEAVILHEGQFIIKNRVSKGYRHIELDKKIIKTRTKKEKNLLEKAAKLINAPRPEETSEINIIKMPFINGKKLSENLEKLEYKKISKEIGKNISKLHDNDIIHGDLTTSNMIWVEDKKLFFIDFGLGFTSKRIEDKAVDLHLIKQALEAKHFSIHKECEKIILKSYNSKDKTKILEQLKKVEERGRYKH
jgi:Kae1-associated kinase Bud32